MSALHKSTHVLRPNFLLFVLHYVLLLQKTTVKRKWHTIFIKHCQVHEKFKSCSLSVLIF